MSAKNRSQSLDMTKGVIWKQLLLFFFPLLFGTFFQTLYNTVDAMIVGRFVGKEGLSAVGGAAAMLINLLVGFFVGVSSGATVVISQYCGAGQDSKVEASVHTAEAIALAGGFLMMLLGFFAAPPFLILMKTPEDTLASSVLYLRIYSLGMIPNMIYNMSSGILRAVGDSRNPTRFLIVGAVANIVLDLWFVAGLHWGVGGAAAATIISQFISAFLSILLLVRVKANYRLRIRRIRFERFYLRRILSIGVPAGFRSSMYAVSNLVIQTSINGFGTNTVAAWAAEGKLDSLYWMLTSSMGTSVTAFVGQNYGAEKYRRVQESMVQSCVIMIFITMLYSVPVYLTSPILFRIFTTDAEVVSIGTSMARYFCRVYCTYFLIEILSGILIGMGDALVPTIITILGVCVLRIVWCLVMVPKIGTITSVLFTYPLTWTVTSVSFLVYYRYVVKRLKARSGNAR